ncbi:MAG: diacylglycerol/lipid kinase family protein [Actinomycetota bacterium]
MTAAKLPATLVINPNAGRLSQSTIDQVADAVAGDWDVEVVLTTGRDSGIEIASEAAQKGAALVVAFGGDGHVNEVVNGIVGTGCALGIIPGGTMNVFARALEVPLDPFDAVRHLAAAGERTVSLGQMDDRYFTFAAGCGFDAEAAGLVEQHLASKRRFGEPFFYWSAFRVLTGSYRHRSPSMTLKGEFGELPVSMAIVSNTGPYAYFFGRPVNIAPRVRLDAGIDVFALRSMRIEMLPMYMWRVVLSSDFAGHGDAFYAHDLEKFEVASDEPFARHVDGETLAPASSARFAIVRDALKVRG